MDVFWLTSEKLGPLQVIRRGAPRLLCSASSAEAALTLRQRTRSQP